MNEHATKPTDFLTEDEVADRYRRLLAPGTLRNWRNKRLGPSFLKVGKGVLYPKAALEAWEAGKTVACDLNTAEPARAAGEAEPRSRRCRRP